MFGLHVTQLLITGGLGLALIAGSTTGYAGDPGPTGPPGPAGPVGPSGTSKVYQYGGAANIAIPGGSADTTLASLTGMPAGTYLAYALVGAQDDSVSTAGLICTLSTQEQYQDVYELPLTVGGPSGSIQLQCGAADNLLEQDVRLIAITVGSVN